jgi:hypothetical protein
MQLSDKLIPLFSKDSEVEGLDAFFHGTRYNALTVTLASVQDSAVSYAIDFRAFNTGIAFRYRFPSPSAMKALAVHEVSEFDFDGGLGGWNAAVQGDSLADAGPEGFLVPVELTFGEGIRITLSEEPGRGQEAIRVVPGPEHEHLLTVSPAAGQAGEQIRTDPPVTPWRILVIHKTKVNE